MNQPTDSERAAKRRNLSPVLRDDDFRPPSSTVRVELGACSRNKPRSRVNNDHYLAMRLGRSQETLTTSLSSADAPRRFCEYGYVMLLADGVDEAGALASRIAVSTLVHLALHYGRWNVRVDSRTAFEIAERLEWCYNKADQVVKQRGRSHPQLHGMGTRLTAAYSAGDELFIARAGRSLAYIFRDGRLLMLSSHNPQRSTSKRPRLVMEDPQPLTGALTDVLGGSGTPQVTVERYPLRDGDVLMLSNEGLINALGDDEIADILAERRRPDDLCRTLVAAAVEAYPTDSMTVLLAQYRIPLRMTP